jgi:crotonobetainyl-CoA:carnitine CoA-transferase CaiB-like acyl-CoA transferase
MSDGMDSGPAGAPRPPLHGVRVLDFTRVIAGPCCTMQLADLGAEVIKIEALDHGDESRQLKPPAVGDESHFFLAFNRSKKSVCLDVRTPTGRDLAQRLAERSDVLVENFRPGVMARLGLDWAALQARHPRLVYCSISAYGQTGPMADRPGYDPVLQAESGMMSITGEPNGPPLRHPVGIVDTITAHYALSAILAALVARGTTGRGQRVDVSLHDCSLAALGNVGSYYLTSGTEPARLGNTHPTAVPLGLFDTKTGPFYLACAADHLFARLCRDVLDRPDLLADTRFATNPARVVHRGEVMAVLGAIFAGQTREHWLDRLRAAEVPAGPVRGLAEALESDEVRRRGMVVTVPHPTAGEVRLLGSPYRFSETGVRPPAAPPLLGQHTAAVLGEVLGLEEAAITELRRTRVIGA